MPASVPVVRRNWPASVRIRPTSQRKTGTRRDIRAMTDQQNIEAARPASADPAVALAKALGQWPPKKPNEKPILAGTASAKTSVEELARELGLKLGDQNKLTIRRIKRGKSYTFIRANGSHVRDARTIR